MDIILIYVTHSDQNNAEKVTDHLFRRRLISGVNSWPISTSYVWRGELKKSEEVVTIYITEQQNRENIQRAILNIHPADNPCVVKLDGTTNRPYWRRVRDNVL